MKSRLEMVGPNGLEMLTHRELLPCIALLCLRHFDKMFG